jgi:hypothetical protein
MAVQTGTKLNRLLHEIPEGLLVDSAWLEKRGYSRSLRNQYVHAGWLERPASKLFRRPGEKLRWEQVVLSLQHLLDTPFIVGGRTALELQGFAHYLPHEIREVHLYGRGKPPSWLKELQVGARFIAHNSERLFCDDPTTLGLTSVGHEVNSHLNLPPHPDIKPSNLLESFKEIPWGHSVWPVIVSTPERAILELLDELPGHESFHQVDDLFSGLSGLSPRRLQKLLTSCKSVKVVRLFFFFADRHSHRWRHELVHGNFDLGSGKRELVKGGRLDKTYNITVPEDLDGVP